MTQVAATEFARNFGRYREEAQHEPVAVVRTTASPAISCQRATMTNISD